MGVSKEIKCPECGEMVIPYPVGMTDDDGNWEYAHTECPVGKCGHIFTPSELK
jgi:hypothetical protein